MDAHPLVPFLVREGCVPALMKHALVFLLSIELAAPLSARTFTDSKGRVMEAEIVSVSGANVTIKRTDGQTFTVPAATFSALDQAFIKAWKPGAPAAPAEPVKAADDVKPGATLILEFPDLPQDRKGQPASCTVKLPKGYDSAKKFPLVVWLAGGDGGNTPNSGFLPEGDFVTVGLPFPKGASNPNQANMVGEYDKIWDYHRAMINKIHERIPNLDKKISIIGGFSNGGHAIDGMLKTRGGKEGGIADYFGIFVLADGGGSVGTKGNYPSLKGKHAYLCYGETSGNADIVPLAAKNFKSRGAEMVLSKMEKTGHEFAAFEQAKVKEWIAKTALPGIQTEKPSK